MPTKSTSERQQIMRRARRRLLIISAVAKFHRISPADILGESRVRSIVRPRQMAFALDAELNPAPVAESARGFGQERKTIRAGLAASRGRRPQDRMVYMALRATCRTLFVNRGLAA